MEGRNCNHPTCGETCRRPIKVKRFNIIPKRSKKKIKEDKWLSDLLKAEDDNSCELKSPVCTGRAQGWDHQQKSTPANRLVRENLKRSCNACNSFKEQNLQWAIANGFHVSRFKK